MLVQQFGNRLRFLRSLKNFTQCQLAEEIGISVQHLGRIERGNSAPSFSLLGRICQVLGVEPAQQLINAQMPQS
ncbi:MAG: helix-turn-helix domain-containing protein, partial [Desulfonatronovibrionaceae bacterium]